MQQVINVITLEKNNLSNVKSFIYDDTIDEENDVIEEVNDYFLTQCEKYDDYDPYLSDDYLDDGYFHSLGENVNIYLTWSI